jgi:hypothetical protein
MLEVFELQFKNSIKYGMTYNQFWFDDPQLYYTYEEVYLDKLKEIDIHNWQLGQYIQFAVGSCLAKECKYPQQPVFFGKPKEKKLSMREKFEIMMSKINQNFN